MNLPPLPDKDAIRYALEQEDYAALDNMRCQYEARRNAIEQSVVQKAIAKRERRAERDRLNAAARR